MRRRRPGGGADTFQPLARQAACEPCPLADGPLQGERQRASHAPPGHAGQCIADANFWMKPSLAINASDVVAVEFIECEKDDADRFLGNCLGANECARGYNDTRCAQCSGPPDPHYRNSTGKCEPCPTDTGIQMGLMAGVGVVVGVFMLKVGLRVITEARGSQGCRRPSHSRRSRYS